MWGFHGLVGKENRFEFVFSSRSGIHAPRIFFAAAIQTKSSVAPPQDWNIMLEREDVHGTLGGSIRTT